LTEFIEFRTYSWAIGTTSFRVSNLKYKIQKQLILLKNLNNIYKNKKWKDKQTLYHKMLVDDGLTTPSNRPEKKARQITSVLVNLGLTNDKRELTEVGEKIYLINNEQNFDNDNIFFIRNDSYIYLKQLLKYELTGSYYSDFEVKPFLVILYACIKLDYMTIEEFTYIIPLIKTVDDLKETIEDIKKIRQTNNKAKYYVIKYLKSLNNYEKALEYMLSQDNLDEEVFGKIMFNRKSSSYTIKFLKLYKSIKSYFDGKDNPDYNKKAGIYSIIETLKNNFNNKYKKHIRELLFDISILPRNKNYINDEIINNFEETEIIKSNNISEFKTNFFYLAHKSKWYSNLEEYVDLNKRVIDISDIFVIKNNQIELEPIPKIIFKNNIESLLEENLLHKDDIKKYEQKHYKIQEDLSDISPNLNIQLEDIIQDLKEKYNDIDINMDLREQINDIVNKTKQSRFNDLVDNHFTTNNLIKLLKWIELGKKTKIENFTEWDADVPTIFEYITGIIWYILSERKFDYDDFYNLDLNASLLPRRFACGGQADLNFNYDDHELIIEVTLTTQHNQRRNELEPVSRHLGNHMLKKGENSYAIFIAPYLDPNVLVSFRSYKNLRFYNTNDKDKFVEGLKIIPLSIKDIIKIIESNIDYKDLKTLIDEIYNNGNSDGYDWYEKVVEPKISEL